MNFGEKLKELRLMKGLTLETVANAIGIGVSTLSEYENNRYDPSSSKMFKLLDFYNIEPFHFLKNGEEYLRITNYSEINKRKVLAIDNLEKSNKT